MVCIDQLYYSYLEICLNYVLILAYNNKDLLNHLLVELKLYCEISFCLELHIDL